MHEVGNVEIFLKTFDENKPQMVILFIKSVAHLNYSGIYSIDVADNHLNTFSNLSKNKECLPALCRTCMESPLLSIFEISLVCHLVAVFEINFSVYTEANKQTYNQADAIPRR